MKTLLVVFLCGLVACQAQGSNINPGIKGKVTSSGIELVKDVLVGWATGWLESYKFPDYDGVVSISNVNLESFSLGNVHITTASPNVANLSLSEAEMHLTGDLKTEIKVFSWLSWEIEAGFSIMASNVDGKLGVTTGLNEAGELTLDILEDSCDVKIGHLSPEVSKTGYDALINIGAKLISKPIADWLSEQACPALKLAMQSQGDKLIKAIPTTFELPWFPVSIDIGLVDEPAIDAQSVALGMKGIAFPTNNPDISFPFVAPPLQDPSGWAKSAYVVLSDYSVNTFLYTSWQTGLLDSLASYADLSVGLPFKLTPKGLAPLIKGLEEYENSTMKFGYELPKAPTVEFSPDGMNISGCIELAVNLTGGKLEEELEAFVLRLDLAVSGGVGVVGKNITGYVSEFYGNFALVNSNIGEVPLKLFNKIMKVFVPQQIVPKINDFLEVGLVIPTYMGFSTSDEEIVIQQNSVELAANVYHESFYPK